MSNSNAILELLDKNYPQSYCDDCLSRELDIQPRQQVNQIAHKLEVDEKIFRQQGTCSSCQKQKIINTLNKSRASFLKANFSILRNMTTARFVHLFLGIGFGCMLFAVLIGQAGYLGRILTGVFFPLAFFMWGFMGIPMIIRREMPWLITIRGWPAVLEGVVLVVLGCGIAVFLWGLFLGLWH